MPRRGPRPSLLLLTLTTAFWTATAYGQDADQPSDADRAAAQVLFDKGRTLMDEAKYEQACAKFAESLRLDTAIGTQLNLANCYEKLGRTASAWIHFYEAASRAKKAGQENRVKIAEERAAALKDRLSYLTIEVPYELKGLEIRRDGEKVGEPQWGTSMPIDPGAHEIVASAPGKKPWTKSVEVTEEGSQLSLTLEPLEDAPEEPKPIGPVPVPVDPTPQLAGAGIAFGLGAVGLGLGIGFGVVAKNKNDDSKTHCPVDNTHCFPEGVKLREDALTFAHVSTTGFVVAGVGIVTGIILLATAPSAGDDSDAGSGGDEQASVHVSPWMTFGAEGVSSAGSAVEVRW